MPEIESRWPRLADPEALTRLTAQMKGKIPASVHARCDMLDAAAVTAAAAKGMVVIACAGEATEGETTQEVPAPAEPEPAEAAPAKKGALPKKSAKPAMMRIKVATLSRDYWCAGA